MDTDPLEHPQTIIKSKTTSICGQLLRSVHYTAQQSNLDTPHEQRSATSLQLRHW
jgi:hypothetical protein